MLKDRHHICKGLMQRQHIGVCRFCKIGMHAVQQRVAGFMHDDVMAETGEYHRAGQHLRVFRPGLKIAEQQGLLLRIVIGIRLAQRMGVNTQSLHKALVGIILYAIFGF